MTTTERKRKKQSPPKASPAVHLANGLAKAQALGDDAPLTPDELAAIWGVSTRLLYEIPGIVWTEISVREKRCLWGTVKDLQRSRVRAA